MRPSSLLAACLLLAASTSTALACRDGRDPHDPMLASQHVDVVNEPTGECKKLGSVHGTGRDGNEDMARQQASDAASEQARQMHGNQMVFTEESKDNVAGSGGTVTQLTKTADVYDCKKEAAPASSSS